MTGDKRKGYNFLHKIPHSGANTGSCELIFSKYRSDQMDVIVRVLKIWLTLRKVGDSVPKHE